MTTPFQPIITVAGLTAAINAHNDGLELLLTHVVLGAASYDPDGSETALSDRREKAAISGGFRAAPTQISVHALFAGFMGTSYVAKEVGFYAGDPDAGGVLFALYSQATGYLHAYRTHGGVDLGEVYNLSLGAAPANSVGILVDPDAAMLMFLLAQHRVDPSAHPQYVPKINGIGFWQTDIAYVTDARVIASNGRLYRAISANSAKDPLTYPAFWRLQDGDLSRTRRMFFGS
jgi:hypothetical protein